MDFGFSNSFKSSNSSPSKNLDASKKVDEMLMNLKSCNISKSPEKNFSKSISPHKSTDSFMNMFSGSFDSLSRTNGNTMKTCMNVNTVSPIVFASSSQFKEPESVISLFESMSNNIVYPTCHYNFQCYGPNEFISFGNQYSYSSFPHLFSDYSFCNISRTSPPKKVSKLNPEAAEYIPKNMRSEMAKKSQKFGVGPNEPSVPENSVNRAPVSTLLPEKKENIMNDESGRGSGYSDTKSKLAEISNSTSRLSPVDREVRSSEESMSSSSADASETSSSSASEVLGEKSKDSNQTQNVSNSSNDSFREIRKLRNPNENNVPELCSNSNDVLALDGKSRGGISPSENHQSPVNVAKSTSVEFQVLSNGDRGGDEVHSGCDRDRSHSECSTTSSDVSDVEIVFECEPCEVNGGYSESEEDTDVDDDTDGEEVDVTDDENSDDDDDDDNDSICFEGNELDCVDGIVFQDEDVTEDSNEFLEDAPTCKFLSVCEESCDDDAQSLQSNFLLTQKCDSTDDDDSEDDDNDEDFDHDYDCQLFNLELDKEDWGLSLTGLVLTNLITPGTQHCCDNSSFEDEDSFLAKEIEKKLKGANEKWNDEIDRDWCESTPTKVTFSDEVEIYDADDWCRKGHWQECARDRRRFLNRVEEMESILSPVLSQEHRSKVFNRLQR